MFNTLQKKSVINENEVNYFRYNFRKATNLSKLHLLPQVRKVLCHVPGLPVVSSSGTPTEKVSDFLDNHLQPLIREGMSYI